MTTTADTGALSGRFLTVSNLLSLARLFLAVPFVLVMLSDAPGRLSWAVGIFIVAVLTDRYDGILARKYGQVSQWGMVLDPLADKVCAAAAALVFVSLHWIPVWFVVVVLGRDAVILAGGLYLKFARGEVVPSNAAGKWTMGVVAATLLCVLLGAPEVVVTVGMLLSLAFLAVSMVLYGIRFVRILRPGKEEDGTSRSV